MSKCPTCKKIFDDEYFEKTGMCSHCNSNIVLSNKELINRSRNRQKKEIESSENFNSASGNKGLSVNSAASKNKQHNTDEDTHSHQSKKENNTLNAEGTVVHSDSYEPPNGNWDNNNSDSHITYVQAQNNSAPKATKEKELAVIPEKENATKKKILNKNNETHSEELETDYQFNFNKDGFYNDTVADELAEPDIIPIASIFRVIAIIISIIAASVIVICFI